MRRFLSLFIAALRFLLSLVNTINYTMTWCQQWGYCWFRFTHCVSIPIERYLSLVWTILGERYIQKRCNLGYCLFRILFQRHFEVLLLSSVLSKLIPMLLEYGVNPECTETKPWQRGKIVNGAYIKDGHCLWVSPFIELCGWFISPLTVSYASAMKKCKMNHMTNCCVKF